MSDSIKTFECPDCHAMIPRPLLADHLEDHFEAELTPRERIDQAFDEIQDDLKEAVEGSIRRLRELFLFQLFGMSTKPKRRTDARKSK